MKKLLFFLLLAACSTETTVQQTPVLYKYGTECFYKPFTNARDDQALCITSALKKHHVQVDAVNVKRE